MCQCTGKFICWVLFWNLDDAVLFACWSPAAQVQGQSPNSGFSSCFSADSNGGCGHLPGRMVSAAGLVMVLQQPVRFLFGSFLKNGRHTAETVAELIACQFGPEIPAEHLLPGFDSGEDFLCCRAVPHLPSRPESLKVLRMAILIDWCEPNERFIADTFYNLSVKHKLGTGLKSTSVFWRMEDCKCQAHLSRGVLKCFVRHQLCQAMGNSPMQCHLCRGAGHGRSSCTITASHPKYGNSRLIMPVCAGCYRPKCQLSIFVCTVKVNCREVYIQDFNEYRCLWCRCCHLDSKECEIDPWLLSVPHAIFEALDIHVDGEERMDTETLFVAQFKEFMACVRSHR